MPTYQCFSCRRLFLDQVTSRGICPACGTTQREGAALPPIEAACPKCGKTYKLSPATAGTRVPCVKCRSTMDIPAPPEYIRPLATDPPGSESPIRERLYLVLILALIPLAMDVLGAPDATRERFKRTIEAHPEIVQKLEGRPDSASLTVDDLLLALPGKKIEGAYLPRDTRDHWGYATVSAAGFLALVLFLFSWSVASARGILLTALFTGTLGVLFLLGVQAAAEATNGVWVQGRGLAVVIFYLLKFIAYSYNAADDPTNPFLLSFFGFTLGVGLCEELVKMVPLFWRRRRSPGLGWRGACVWGLASGVGFGISEGVMYASDFYNGIAAGNIYLVRFVSCVALHAVWSASVGIMIWRHQHIFEGRRHWLAFIGPIFRIVWVPMVLHGLYDTLLKRDHDLLALGVAAASFVWLALVVEWVRRQSPVKLGSVVLYETKIA